MPTERFCIPFPFDTFNEMKRQQKYTNYSEFKYQTAEIQKVRKVEVILVVIGALATKTKYYDNWIKKLDWELKIEALKYPYSLGTARITRKVLNIKKKKKKKKS